MTLTEKLEAALSSKNGTIIVAIPEGYHLKEAQAMDSSLQIRKTLKTSIFPYCLCAGHSCFVYGRKEKFSSKKYRNNFLEKCKYFENVKIEVY